ncbi:UNVERIFIED_CONTAM: hypothetical protein Sradi_0692600 [Sesamum radiatum]|uniref:Gag-pol polyprotein n=1 Tax=Sesamum radiatum TaxID=300843 RepID=A0AAW2VQD7_SESRA
MRENSKKMKSDRGYLKEYVDRNNQPQEGNSRPPREGREKEARQNQTNQNNPPTTGVIGVISSGPAGGDSARARKAALRSTTNIAYETFGLEIMINEESREKQEIIFGSQDLEKDVATNNEAVVIYATIANFCVKKVLVDSGSSADIIFYKAFSQKGINKTELTWVNTPLTSFSGSIVEPVGEVTLPMSLGSYPKWITKMVKFLVVDTPSAYNVILGRPSLNAFQAIASTYHLKLKFLTLNGIGEEVGDRRQVRECYANTLKKKSNDPPNESSNRRKASINAEDVIATRDEKDPLATKKRKVEARMRPIEEVKTIELIQQPGLKTTKIGTLLDPQLENMLVAFLQGNISTFT